MSLPEQEARALEAAEQFLRDLSSGAETLASRKEVRQKARDILRHYPLAPGMRWLAAGDQRKQDGW